MKKSFLYIVSVIYILSLGWAPYKANQHSQFLSDTTIYNDSLVLRDSTETVVISAVGDIMCHATQMNYARVDSTHFDFNPVFREVKKYLNSTDLMLGNLETVLAGRERGLKGYPVFNTPDEFLYALKNSGFDHLFLSNNHILDMGWEGARRTARLIDSLGMGYSGVVVKSDKSDSLRIYNVKGIKIGVASFTYGHNHSDELAGSKILRIEKDALENTINSAKRFHKVDVMIVYFHFGKEYSRYPSDYQKRVVRWAVDAGADLIFASHPHVIQPVEFIKSNNSIFDSVLVTYSLGNFVSNQRWRFSDCGIIINVRIEKNKYSDAIKLKKVDFIPVWVYKGRTDRSQAEYVIFPATQKMFDKTPSYFSDDDKIKMIESYYDTKRVVDSLGAKIQIRDIN